jgi:hypothetical protein
MIVDQGLMKPNYVVSNLNTCGGTLLSGASCNIYVSFNAITNSVNPVGLDKLEIWYRGASIANKVNVGNGTHLENLLSVDCDHLGNCPVYTKSIAEHHLILSSMDILTPDNIISSTNTDNGCIAGYDFGAGVCNINLSLKQYPVGSQTGWVAAYIKYYVNDYYTITFIRYADGSIHLDNTQTQQLSFMTPSLYANSYFDDNGVFVSNGKPITITNWNNPKSMTIQKINFIPDENLEQIPLCLVSQFEFSLIPSKKLKLNFQERIERTIALNL